MKGHSKPSSDKLQGPPPPSPIHTEEWVKFIRIPCKEGFIDRWHGDAIDDPNKPNQSKYCINSMSTYYRFNGGRWYHKDDFDYGFSMDVYHLVNEFSASDILVNYFYLKLVK